MRALAPQDPKLFDGLPRDPATWAEDDPRVERWKAALNELPNPTFVALGIPAVRSERTPAQQRLSEYAYKSHQPVLVSRGGVVIGNQSIEQIDGRFVPAKDHGSTSYYSDGDAEPVVIPAPRAIRYRVARARRRGCSGRVVGKVRARARSALRGGRPAAAGGKSSRSSSSGGDAGAGDDPEPEPREPPPLAPGASVAPFLLAGCDRRTSDSMARIGVPS